MHAAFLRLRSDERWWAAEVAFRLVACILLGLAVLCGGQLERSVKALPAHEATYAEFALSGFTVFAGALGLACLIEGPRLFRLVPVPPRPLL